METNPYQNAVQQALKLLRSGPKGPLNAQELLDSMSVGRLDALAEADLKPSDPLRAIIPALLGGQLLTPVGMALFHLLMGGLWWNDFILGFELFNFWGVLGIALFFLTWFGQKRLPTSLQLLGGKKAWWNVAWRLSASMVAVSVGLRIATWVILNLPWPWEVGWDGWMLRWLPTILVTLGVAATGGRAIKRLKGQGDTPGAELAYKALASAVPFTDHEARPELTTHSAGWRLRLGFPGERALALSHHDNARRASLRVIPEGFELDPEAIRLPPGVSFERVDEGFLLTAGDGLLTDARAESLALALSQLLTHHKLPRRAEARPFESALVDRTPTPQPPPPQGTPLRVSLTAPTTHARPRSLRAIPRWLGPTPLRALLGVFIFAMINPARWFQYPLYALFGWSMPHALDAMPPLLGSDMEFFFGTLAILAALCAPFIRAPRKALVTAPNDALVLDGSRLSLSSHPQLQLDLEQPFTVQLSRAPSQEDPGPALLGVTVRQRGDALRRGDALTFQVAVQEAQALDALPELTLDAPCVEAAELARDLWPRLQWFAQLHGEPIPLNLSAPAEAHAPPPIQASPLYNFVDDPPDQEHQAPWTLPPTDATAHARSDPDPEARDADAEQPALASHEIKR